MTSEEILATQQLFVDFAQRNAALNFYQLSIIEKHKGKIEVISEPMQKTEFAITLPRKESFM